MRISKKISMCLVAAGIFLGSTYEGECVKSGSFVNGRGDTLIMTLDGEVHGTYLEGGKSWPWRATALSDKPNSYRYEHSCKRRNECASEIHPTGTVILVESVEDGNLLVVDVLSDDALYSKHDIFTKKEEK